MKERDEIGAWIEEEVTRIYKLPDPCFIPSLGVLIEISRSYSKDELLIPELEGLMENVERILLSEEKTMTLVYYLQKLIVFPVSFYASSDVFTRLIEKHSNEGVLQYCKMFTSNIQELSKHI